MVNRSFVVRSMVVVLIGAGTFFFSYITSEDVSTEAEVLGSSYFLYTTDHYQESRGEHDVTVLNFHADWCPSCSEFEPTLIQAIEESSTDTNLIAYRVPFGDEGESKEGKELAEVYGVKMQTTTLILNRRGEVFKSYFTPVDKSEVTSTIRAAAISE
ncbi:MAG: TlpA family protein disulfide reductase [Candidatus Dojkabacteria bacterium]